MVVNILNLEHYNIESLKIIIESVLEVSICSSLFCLPFECELCYNGLNRYMEVAHVN